MSATDSKTPRITVAKAVGATFAPSRMRTLADEFGLNRSVEDDLNKERGLLLTLKKVGGPVKPTSPDRIVKKGQPEPDATQRAEHAKVRAKYLQELKKYNEFVSERYLVAEKHYIACKLLNRLHTLLTKEKKSLHHDDEVAEVINLIHDKPAAQRKKEPAADYSKRVSEFKPHGLKVIVGATDLANPESVLGTINKIKADHPDVQVFLKRDEISKGRVRFNDEAAVVLSTLADYLVEELVLHGMIRTIKTGKKVLQPDHVVDEGIEECSLYVLVKDTPHFLAILDRQDRRAEYDDKIHQEKQLLIQKAKAEAKKSGSKFKAPKYETPTFQEEEVKNGYAVRRDVPVIDEDGKPVLIKKVDKKTKVETSEPDVKYHYEWFGIDIDENESSESDVNFKTYVAQICDRVKSEQADTSYMTIRISNNIKKFCSDLVADITAMMSDMANDLLAYDGSKTVNEKLIVTLIKLIMRKSGKLESTYKGLLDQIDTRVNRLRAKKTGLESKEEILAQPSKAEQTGEITDAKVVYDDLEEEPVPVPAVVAKPVANGGAVPKPKGRAAVRTAPTS